MKSARIPGATYRLQFHAGFTFRDARRLVPFLSELGITDVYASPYMKARAGSSHGYDVANPNALNPEIGTEADYRAFVNVLAEHGMGQVVDVVPNHMGIGDANNGWWLDVLENGPSSVYATFFDIDWNPLRGDVQDTDKIILPILGDQYGRVLENGELVAGYQNGAFFITYYDAKLPLSLPSYATILRDVLKELESSAAADAFSALIQGVREILAEIEALAPQSGRDRRRREERDRQKEQLKQRLAELDAEWPGLRRSVRHALRKLNGKPGDSRSFDALDRLLENQSYRLAYWRVAGEEINYRRFFDINDLVAVRVEDPRVFQATSALLMVLVRTGTISGVRIDHPDGLRDPAAHLWRLQRACFIELNAGREVARGPSSAQDTAVSLGALFDAERTRDPQSVLTRPMYLVVEKILASGETLRDDWPVHGTTGYDFLNVLNGIFVERANRNAIDHIYTRFTGEIVRYRDIANSTRKMVMLVSLPSEINELAYLLKRIASRDRRQRDFTLNSLTFAIRELIACLGVYRTYIDPRSGIATGADRQVIEEATAEAKRRNPRTDPSVFDFVSGTLLLDAPERPQNGVGQEGQAATEEPDEDEIDDRRERLRFIAKFQQTSSPVMAKGVEDTAFYVYNRLISLNEVGGDPEQFGVSLTAFHRRNLLWRAKWPSSMLTTSTHDTKRSEDVRARINVLSELPHFWKPALTRWSRINGRRKTIVDGRPAPERNEEYLLYQVLLGVWPFNEPGPDEMAELRERVVAFMTKAVKEAKVRTSWINPNLPYEEALQQFVRGVLEDGAPNPFLDDFRLLQEKIAHFGIFNALSQTLLKIASPGVPDTYQGNEMWDLSLVDPDNRRPVDYARRRHLLNELRREIKAAGSDLTSFASSLVDTKEDGRIKLFTLHRGLWLRRQCEEIFARGSYIPLRATGAKKRHVCAFGRHLEGGTIVAVAPVLIAGLMKAATVAPLGESAWGATMLSLPGVPGDVYENVFTGERLEAVDVRGKAALPLREVLANFPVALLRGDNSS